ncbi:PREDICTED: sodium-dependent neutral amino acid transporter B(0)AT3-like isoform X3 [Nanorana parkeri]|uniref:sodium-dependent neutral amino acid transporter B(0)AT3-like isoform X3 n=1 Tax=Nanorana parkeri TaxID=125878 RepID=UPI0008544FD7|nr:PREDICTED: sodium-dependent neutral amino acid transporter B(0)AT3-like isoform X3 [Nanorana parkeri]
MSGKELTKVPNGQDRPKWDNKIQYLLTCIGFAVGLGNVWRFPYLCQTYGGGAYEECSKSSAVNYYWYRKTLNITTTINENGDLQWWMVISLAAAWSAVYLCTIRGIQSTGKAVYITATFPYIVLTIFLIRGLTLPGAIDGLRYLFTPDMEILLNPKVWLDAATQIFYSLSLGFGGLIAFSSYNPEKNDCEKDAVSIAVINSVSSLYASIPIFCILGFKAKHAYWDCLDRNIISLLNEFDISEWNITRNNYIEVSHSLNATYPERINHLMLKECTLQEFLDQSASGTGLAFIVFTEAIIQMPGSQVWAILFFIMLFTLGLSSMFGNVEGVLTPILDLKIFPKSVPVEAISGLICLISFLFSLIFTMGSGNYWLQIFDTFTGSLTLLIVVFCEVIAVTYVYGIERFSEDIKWMTGRRPNIYWQATWRFISPLLMGAMFLSYIVVQFRTPLTYETWDPSYEEFPMKKVEGYPGWTVAICVLLVAIPSMCIPLVALIHFVKIRLTKTPSCEPRDHANNLS